MKKKLIKILTTILILSVLIMTIITTIKTNNSIAFSIGQDVEWTRLSIHNNLYCVDHGYAFKKGMYYCYEIGSVDPRMAYLVATRENKIEGSTGEEDLVSNAIWEIVEGTGNNLPGLDKLLDEANAAAQIKSTGNIEIIEKPATPIMENENGEYGPFIINYPQSNGKLGGGEVKIFVNGNEVQKETRNLQQFYFTEEDGILFGQPNNIEFVYNATYYTGTYALFRPYAEYEKSIVCPYCNARYVATIAQACIVNGTIQKYKCDWVYPQTMEHNEIFVGTKIDENGDVQLVYEDCPYAAQNIWYDYWWSEPELTQGELDQIVNEFHKQIGWQDLIYIEPVGNPVTENLSFDFWAGVPDIEIDFNKINTENEKIQGAQFDISIIGGQIVGGNTTISTSSTDSSIIRIKPDKEATTVTVILTETEAPEEYAKLEEPIVIEYNWDNQSRKWKNNTEDFQFNTGENVTIATGGLIRSISECVDKYTITAENRRKIIVNLTKTDNSIFKNIIANMTFDINVLGGTCEQTSITTDATGRAEFLIIPDGTGDVTLILTEHENPYYVQMEPIVITFTYRSGTWQPTIDASIRDLVSIDGAVAVFDLQVKNKAKIEKISLIKLNKSAPGERIPGITFRISFANAKTLTGTQSIIVTTDINGQIEIGALEIIDPTKEVYITIEEIGVPDDGLIYKGLYPGGSATITLRHRQDGCTSDHSYVTATYLENMVSIEVENDVIMGIAGRVWLDGQTGLKPVVAPNGIKDSGEDGVPGVIVNLVRNDGMIIGTTTTDANGYYLFEDIPVSTTGVQYHVEFIYDGINYVAVVGGDSDATEIDRTGFNNKFSTIIKNAALGTDGSITSLEYSSDGKIQTMNGNVVKEKYGIKAITNSYNRSSTNVDLGLVKKGVDLSAVTDIYSAKVIINGKEHDYSYNDIISLDDNITITEAKPSYSLYLYNSDYNYRINDYSSLPVLTETSHPTLDSSLYSTMLDKKKMDGELKVQLTYQVLLNNQSATDATINSIAYYYDTGYVLEGVIPDEQVQIDGKTYNKVIIPINKTFTDSNNQEIYTLQLIVGEDGLGALKTGEMKNWVEIISYSTNEGCIDADSAPDNILEHKTEDDTDDSRGLNIQINLEDRTVSGYVFEDIKSENPGQYNTGDGLYQNSEKKISDVIVQLIEIKNVTVGSTNLRLEYIWQETVSGSSTVKYITNDGKNIATYNVVNEPGHYTFEDFIPGNYIVRFIYGDGTYYDQTIDGTATTEASKEKIRTYNGQDYKSTIDQYYDKKWYNSLYAENASMARDNEARRLEEIGYATSADVSDLNIDSKAKLEDTWMCAETSLIDIPISAEAGHDVQLRKNINFGLVARPQATLELEKHVTSLKVGDIVNCTANIYNYIKDDGESVKIDTDTGRESINFAYATTKDPNNRGEWIVDTQLSSITANPTIEIRYSYVVRNIGDSDYIGAGLENEITNGLNTGKTLSEIYNSIAQTVKTDTSHVVGKYLGTAYYSGQVSTDVGIGLETKIEDYLSTSTVNHLTLREGSYFTSRGNTTKDVWVSSGVSGTEEVEVMQTENINIMAGTEYVLTAEVYNDSINIASGSKNLSFKSYAAQLIPSTGSNISKTGMTIKNITLGNLKYVQGYTRDILIKDITPEPDEAIAETVTITIDTGADKETPVILITTIVSGLAIVAIGIVFIKKFIIK